MEMREQDVPDSVTVCPGLHEIHERPWTKIQQERLVGLDQIARRCSRGMDIGAGAEDRQAHGGKVKVAVGSRVNTSVDFKFT